MSGGAAEITVLDADGVRTVTIDRPEARNAMTFAMRERIAELFRHRRRPPENENCGCVARIPRL